MNTNKSIRVASVLAAILGATNVNATSISQQVFACNNGHECANGGGNTAYDAGHELFLVSGEMRGFSRNLPGSTEGIVFDSRVALAAQVDNDGNLAGGIFQWTGGSEQLNIGADSLLMSAAVVGFNFRYLEFDPNEPRDENPPGIAFFFQFLLEPTFVNPLLFEFSGDLYAYDTFDFIPWPGDPDRPFDHSFTGEQFLTYFLGPVDAPTNVPEPPASALLILAAAGLLAGRRWRSQR